MANTVTNTRIIASQDLIVQQVLLVSDGSEETDLVVYDSSAVASVLGKTDPLVCTLLRAKLVYQNAAVYSNVTLEYDATTDVICCPLGITAGVGGVVDADFRDHGGVKWTAGTGSTGDIVLTTSALDSGDAFLLYLFVKPF